MEMEMEMEGATADDGRATAAEAALRPADDEQQKPVRAVHLINRVRTEGFFLNN